MTPIDPSAPVLALILGGLSLFIWSVLFGMHFRSHDRRRFHTLMYATGLLAACGTFASAIGFSISSGLFDFDTGTESGIQYASTFFASMGRGALLMGGLFLLLGNADMGYKHPHNRANKEGNHDGC